MRQGTPRILSLFSGIGTLDLAVECVTGGRTVMQVEALPYRRAVLEKHWPDVPKHADVCTYGGTLNEADIICGGFPCRDISSLGSKQGLDGKHSGLWTHYKDIIDHVKPQAVFVENVSDLRTRGLGRVLQDLARLGYDAAWTVSRANEVGLYIQRARIFLLAVSKEVRRPGDMPAWLQQHEIQSVPVADGRDAPVPRATDRAGEAYDGPQPGVRRTAYGNPRGLDARRRRARVGCTGDAVVVKQAVMSYHWCVGQLTRGVS